MQTFIIYICCGLILMMLAIVASILSFKSQPMISEELIAIIKREKQYFLSKIPASQQVQEWEIFCNALSSLSTAMMAKRQEGVDDEVLLEITKKREDILQENARKLQFLILDQSFKTPIYQDFEEKSKVVDIYGNSLYEICRQ